MCRPLHHIPLKALCIPSIIPPRFLVMLIRIPLRFILMRPVGLSIQSVRHALVSKLPRVSAVLSRHSLSPRQTSICYFLPKNRVFAHFLFHPFSKFLYQYFPCRIFLYPLSGQFFSHFFAPCILGHTHQISYYFLICSTVACTGNHF